MHHSNYSELWQKNTKYSQLFLNYNECAGGYHLPETSVAVIDSWTTIILLNSTYKSLFQVNKSRKKWSEYNEK